MGVTNDDIREINDDIRKAFHFHFSWFLLSIHTLIEFLKNYILIHLLWISFFNFIHTTSYVHSIKSFQNFNASINTLCENFHRWKRVDMHLYSIIFRSNISLNLYYSHYYAKLTPNEKFYNSIQYCIKTLKSHICKHRFQKL